MITPVTGLVIPAIVTPVILIVVVILVIAVVTITPGVMQVLTVTSGGSVLFAPEKCDT